MAGAQATFSAPLRFFAVRVYGRHARFVCVRGDERALACDFTRDGPAAVVVLRHLAAAVDRRTPAVFPTRPRALAIRVLGDDAFAANCTALPHSLAERIALTIRVLRHDASAVDCAALAKGSAAVGVLAVGVFANGALTTLRRTMAICATDLGGLAVGVGHRYAPTGHQPTMPDRLAEMAGATIGVRYGLAACRGSYASTFFRAVIEEPALRRFVARGRQYTKEQSRRCERAMHGET